MYFQCYLSSVAHKCVAWWDTSGFPSEALFLTKSLLFVDIGGSLGESFPRTGRATWFLWLSMPILTTLVFWEPGCSGLYIYTWSFISWTLTYLVILDTAIIFFPQYVFTRYNKPFFSTFAKTSMFVLYLLGFIVWKPWRQQCTRGFRGRHAAFVSITTL